MRKWETQISALDPFTGEMKLWGGPSVPGISFSDAERYCQENGLGYCKVIGQLIAEIPCRPGTFEADWDNEINYENNN